MSAHKQSHPRKQYVDTAYTNDSELQDLVVRIRVELTGKSEPVMAHATFSDDQIIEAIGGHAVLDSYPLDLDDFNDLIQFDKSMAGTPLRMIQMDKEGMVSLRFHSSIKDHELLDFWHDWKEAHLPKQDDRNPSYKYLDLWYALLKAEKRMRPSEITKALRDGKLPNYGQLDLTHDEVNLHLHRAHDFIANKNFPRRNIKTK